MGGLGSARPTAPLDCGVATGANGARSRPTAGGTGHIHYNPPVPAYRRRSAHPAADASDDLVRDRPRHWHDPSRRPARRHGRPSPDPGLKVADLATLLAVGGWPGNLGLTVDQSLRAVRDYLNEIRGIDISRADGTAATPRGWGGYFVRWLATLPATPQPPPWPPTPVTPIALPTTTPSAGTSPRPRVHHRLERLMIVEDQPAWHPTFVPGPCCAARANATRGPEPARPPVRVPRRPRPAGLRTRHYDAPHRSRQAPIRDLATGPPRRSETIM